MPKDKPVSPATLPQDVLDKQTDQARLLDELKWWQDENQLRYRSEDPPRPQAISNGSNDDGDEPDKEGAEDDDASSDRINLAR